MLAAGIIGGLVSIGSAIYGGVQAGKQAKEYQDNAQNILTRGQNSQRMAVSDYEKNQGAMLSQMGEESKELFNRDYYTEAVNRAEVANVLRNSRQRQDRMLEAGANMAAITGETPEAAMVRQRAANDAEADAVANATATASVAKDRAKATYSAERGQLASLTSQMNQSLMNSKVGMEQSIMAGQLGMQDKLYTMKSQATQAATKGGMGLGNTGLNLMGALYKPNI